MNKNWRTVVRASLAVFLWWASLSAHALTVSIQPPNPSPTQTFTVRVIGTPPECPFLIGPPTITGNEILVGLGPPGFGLPGGCDGVTTSIGPLPQGVYQITVRNLVDGSTTTAAIAVGAVSVTSVPLGGTLVWLLSACGLVLAAWRSRSRLSVTGILAFIGVCAFTMTITPQKTFAVTQPDDDASRRELILLFDPRDKNNHVDKILARLNEQTTANATKAKLGNPKKLRKLLGEAHSNQSRLEELGRTAPFASEFLLSQYLIAEYETEDAKNQSKGKLKSDKDFYGVFDHLRLKPSAQPISYPAQVVSQPLFFTIPPGNPGQTTWGLSAIFAHDAHLKTKGRAHVAVIDRGIKQSHPQLLPNLRRQFSKPYRANSSPIERPGYDAEEVPLGPNPIVNYTIGHGTHVAGIVGARDSASAPYGMKGVCPECSLQIHSVDFYTEAALSAALVRAVSHGAQVVNLSLNDCDTPLVCKDGNASSFCVAMDYAYKRGVAVLASAGNCNGYGSRFPANGDQVIAVGGMERRQNADSGWYWVTPYANVYGRLDYGSFFSQRPATSSQGEGQIHVVAPATDILSTFFHRDGGFSSVTSPDTTDQWGTSCGHQLETNFGTPFVALPLQPTSYPGNRNIAFSYGNCTGTSMAAPFASGVAALALSTNPLLSPEQVKSTLIGSGSANAGANVDFTRQIVNANRAIDYATNGGASVPPPNTLANRLTPLFSLRRPNAGNAALDGDRLYTTAPQQAAAAITGTLPPNQGSQYTGSGSLLSDVQYASYPSDLCMQQITNCTPTAAQQQPRASLMIYSTPVPPSAGVSMVPLYRLHHTLYRVHGYVTNAQYPNPSVFPLPVYGPDPNQTGATVILTHGWEFDGVEGHLVSPSSPRPSGSVYVCRKYSTYSGTIALYPSDSATCLDVDLDGTLYNHPWIGGEVLGYGFVATSTVDADDDGTPDAVEFAEGRLPFTKDNDIFNNTALFVKQQYRDFLRREATPAELSAGVAALAGGQTRAAFIEAIIRGSEYENYAGPNTRLYRAYFLREPDVGGLNFWYDKYRSAEWTFIGISQFFATSPEFKARYGALTNEQFVTLIYQNVLGRAPDPSGFAFWTSELNSERRSRGQVMADFSESPENKNINRPRVQIVAVEASMKRVQASASDIAAYTPIVLSGGSIQPIINTRLGEPAYRSRFLP